VSGHLVDLFLKKSQMDPKWITHLKELPFGSQIKMILLEDLFEKPMSRYTWLIGQMAALKVCCKGKGSPSMCGLKSYSTIFDLSRS